MSSSGCSVTTDQTIRSWLTLSVEFSYLYCNSYCICRCSTSTKLVSHWWIWLLTGLLLLFNRACKSKTDRRIKGDIKATEFLKEGVVGNLSTIIAVFTAVWLSATNIQQLRIITICDCCYNIGLQNVLDSQNWLLFAVSFMGRSGVWAVLLDWNNINKVTVYKFSGLIRQHIER